VRLMRGKVVMCSLGKERLLYFLGVVDCAATTHTQGSGMAWRSRLVDCLRVQVTIQQQHHI
jgi:hypothetical protein